MRLKIVEISSQIIKNNTDNIVQKKTVSIKIIVFLFVLYEYIIRYTITSILMIITNISFLVNYFLNISFAYVNTCITLIMSNGCVLVVIEIWQIQIIVTWSDVIMNSQK